MIIEITKPDRLIRTVCFSFLYLIQKANPNTVTTRPIVRNAKTESMNRLNIDITDEGGISPPKLIINNIVVTNIELFNPIRIPTGVKPLRLNRKEIADTMQKNRGGRKLTRILR